jgi:Uma2 family endonuclease
LPHGYSNTLLDRILHAACPPELFVTSVGLGVDMGGRKTYYVPDLLVVKAAAVRRRKATEFQPTDVRLAVEVLSPGSARADLVLKRHDYGAAGIPQYWIVDPVAQTLTVHAEPFRDGYRQEHVVKAGEPWTATEPFPVALDPAEFT